METILNATVCVQTLYKDINNNLQEHWLDLNKYKNIESFYEKCKQIHNDENDPTFVYPNWAYIPGNFISEIHIDKRIFELIEHASKLTGDDRKGFHSFLDGNEFEIDNKASDIINMFNEQFIGYFESYDDFGRYLLKNMGYKIDEILDNYFNYGKFARKEVIKGSFYSIGNSFFLTSTK